MKMIPMKFHTGYYQLHDNPQINFQMNRWIGYLGGSGLEDMRSIAPRLKDYADFKREFMALADRALAEGRTLNAAYYYRSAEFYMWAGDPMKKQTRQKFLGLVKKALNVKDGDHYSIPYEDGDIKGMLPAYRLKRDNPKGTIVIHGGYDSYIEEFLPVILFMGEQGYDIVAFEGPGQGGALEDYGLVMTTDWYKPVKAVLDYFKLDGVTLLGVSLGGCLALRAAAFEPRVKRAVAYDVCYDLFAAMMGRADPVTFTLFQTMLGLGAAPLLNTIVYRKIKKNLTGEWAINQGMHVMGVSSPFELYRKFMGFKTSDISHLVTQDVLVMAGTEDHSIPVDQFYRQIEALKNARSLTARLFTRAEGAQNHCQIGNLGLAVRVIAGWIDTASEGSDGWTLK